MNDWQELLTRRVRKAVFDTNVFLAYVVGTWNLEMLSRFSRTAAYTTDDYRVLDYIVTRMTSLVVTPAILAEFCNLADKLNDTHHGEVFLAAKEIVEQSSDRRKESRLICDSPSFPRLGFADASVIDCSTAGMLLVTDDVGCYLESSRLGGRVININHLRDAEWLQ